MLALPLLDFVHIAMSMLKILCSPTLLVWLEDDVCFFVVSLSRWWEMPALWWTRNSFNVYQLFISPIMPWGRWLDKTGLSERHAFSKEFLWILQQSVYNKILCLGKRIIKNHYILMGLSLVCLLYFRISIILHVSYLYSVNECVLCLSFMWCCRW